jgi:hypothetical protein
MGFLAPFFFVGLAALAVPVLIHLIQRERKDAIVFPSLMFIRQVPYKSTRRRRIRNWALFLLRCFAILLLIAAFARPFVERELAATGPLATAREVVLLVDRSYSMGYGDRFTRALDAARSAIANIGPEERATIVFFDAGASVANQATGDHLRLGAAVDSVTVSSSATRYGPALKLAQGILESSELPRREVILISDFQRTGWDGGEGVRMPAGTIVTPVQISDTDTRNVAVAGVTFRREPQGGRERVTATARLVNRSGDAVRGIPVALDIDGREIQSTNVNVAANDAAGVTFQPFTLGAAEMRGTVRIGGDALSADDRFHFVLAPGQAVGVLVLDGGMAQSTLFLERALAIGDAPPFRTETKRASQFRASDLVGRSVVVLNDAAFPSGAAGRRLDAWVRNGGGLIAVLGPRSASAGWGEGTAIMPGTPGRVTDRDAGGALGNIEYSHPVFEVFRAPRSGDLSAARFFRYRSLALADSTNRVIARFDDGSPALVEANVGRGRVLVWASTLDNFWTDLPIQATFLPFVHQLTRYAAGFAEPSPWFTAGQVLDVLGGPSGQVADSAAAEEATEAAAQPVPPPATGDIVAIAPSGERTPVTETGLLVLGEQGFYQVRDAGERGDFAVAVNLDLAESDLQVMDPRELVAAVEPRGDAARTTTTLTIRPEDRERRQSLWWYLLIGAFALLATETVLSNRLSRRRAAVTQ